MLEIVLEYLIREESRVLVRGILVLLDDVSGWSGCMAQNADLTAYQLDSSKFVELTPWFLRLGRCILELHLPSDLRYLCISFIWGEDGTAHNGP
jgi:hypothetical protein